MTRTKYLAVAFVLAVAISAIVFASQPELTGSLFSSKANAQASSQIPSHILYDQVFRLTISFRRKAEIQQLTGETVTSLPNYFKEEAQLTEQENEILQQVALEFLQEMQPVDDRAVVLIAEAWEAFPDGVVPEGQNVSQPPELFGLQEQRNALALRYRDRLNDLFGSKRFGKFDVFVQGDFASKFQSIQTPQN